MSYVRTEEHRLEMAEKTRKHFELHPMTEEVRIKKSQAMKELFQREPHRAEFIRKNMLGKKHSLGLKASIETRRKQSIAHMGNCNVGRGKVHPRWKGGRITVGRREYILLYSPEHPFKTKKGYVAEHRLVAEKMIGRYLTKDEVVHHINGVKTDNRESNLMVFDNSSEHYFFHKKMEKIGMDAFAQWRENKCVQNSASLSQLLEEASLMTSARNRSTNKPNKTTKS